MHEIPLWVIGAGVVGTLVGMVLSLHGIGQREPSRVGNAGIGLVYVGMSVAMGVLLFNGTVVILRLVTSGTALLASGTNAWP